VFERMPLKRVLGEVGRLENAFKKRSMGSHCGISEVGKTSVNTITEVAVCKHTQHDK